MDPAERTFSDLAQEFLGYQRIYTNDPASSESNLRILGRHLGERQLAQITAREIEVMIVACLQGGIAKSTINW